MPAYKIVIVTNCIMTGIVTKLRKQFNGTTIQRSCKENIILCGFAPQNILVKDHVLLLINYRPKGWGN